jgi:hypothetical protein
MLAHSLPPLYDAPAGHAAQREDQQMRSLLGTTNGEFVHPYHHHPSEHQSAGGKIWGQREGGKRQSCSSVLLDHWMTSNGIQDRVGEAGKQGALH